MATCHQPLRPIRPCVSTLVSIALGSALWYTYDAAGVAKEIEFVQPGRVPVHDPELGSHDKKVGRKEKNEESSAQALAHKEVPGLGKTDVDIWNYLDGPSALNYSLPTKVWKVYVGQVGQDKWVDQVLQKQTGLFVVESGANNGLSHSNSIFFETSRHWECLLVEANPYLIEKLLALHRKCHVLRAGLSFNSQVGSFPFELDGALGGFTASMSAEHKQRADREQREGRFWMKGEQGSGNTINLTTFPFNMVLEALGRRTVDYWSLDTEGSELGILEGVDFSKVEVGVMTVEHNNDQTAKAGILKRLQAAGLERVVAGIQDDYYANRRYFEKRQLPFPTR